MRPSSLLLAGVAIVFVVGHARAAGPVCALLDPEKDARVALLEAKLLAEPDTTWVERARVDQVLAEQKLQALFGAGGVGERVKLGKLLKADVLVLVRRAKDAREPALELVISETGGGLRLLIRGVPISADPDADVTALLTAAREGIKKHATKVTEVVAVPPFVSRDLSTEHDHLKAALARVAEQAAQARPGVQTLELEEAQALAKELGTAVPGTAVARPLPLYLLGEYRHTGTGANRTVALTLRAERGGKPVGKGEERSVKAEEAATAVRTWAVAALAAGGAPLAPDAKADADQLVARAREFGRIGNWD